MQYIILISLILIVVAKDTNDEVRSCMMNALQQTSKCKNQYTKCFDDIDCNNQYDDLFRNCVIPKGSTIYESNCVNYGFIQITNNLLSDLFDCLVRQCNVMQGKLITPNEVSNISQCFSSVLLDSSKCWIKSKNCSETCQESLNKLEECDEYIQINDIANTRKCLQSKTHTDSTAKEIQLCLLQQCL